MLMREIKFRAWDAKQKRFGYIDLNSSDFGDPSWFDDPLMQHTGLKDVDGTEIYEGDLIKLDRSLHPFYPDIDIIGEVFWSKSGAEWMHTYHDDRPAKKMFDGCKVVGNIYENPDLLKR